MSARSARRARIRKQPVTFTAIDAAIIARLKKGDPVDLQKRALQRAIKRYQRLLLREYYDAIRQRRRTPVAP